MVDTVIVEAETPAVSAVSWPAIIAGGPHMCARRVAISGTARASRAESILPVAPVHGFASGWLAVTVTLSPALRACSSASSSRKMKS